MKTHPTPNYGYDILTAQLPFEMENQDMLPSKTSNTRKKDNRNITRKTGRSKKRGNTSVPVLAVKTYKLPLDLVRQVESVAYWRRKKIQDVMAEALTMFLDTIPAEDRQSIPGQ